MQTPSARVAGIELPQPITTPICVLAGIARPVGLRDCHCTSRSERTIDWDRARDRPDRNTRNQQQQHGYERRDNHKRHYNDYHDDHRRWDNRNRDGRSDYYVQHHEREQRPRLGTGNEPQSHHQDSPPYRSGRLANPTLRLTRENGITRPIIKPFFGSSPEDYNKREAGSNTKHSYGSGLEKGTILTSFNPPLGRNGGRRTDPVHQRYESGSVTKNPTLPLFSTPPNAGRDYRAALEQRAKNGEGLRCPVRKSLPLASPTKEVGDAIEDQVKQPRRRG
ncbi:hypothetical protein LTR22_021893 [Elasticomyces elasticus]|nr:hypothetical protein LTR22_021893 [Elasticomyces elasticus]